MSGVHLAVSPNWYCSCLSDCHKYKGHLYFAVGGRNSVNLLRIDQNPPTYEVCLSPAHSERVVAVSFNKFSDSSLQCCTAGDDRRVRVWNLTEKALLHEHDTHQNKITVAQWSPTNANHVISGDEKGGLVLWDLTHSVTKTYTPENGHVFALACSPHEDRKVAVGYRGGVVLVVSLQQRAQVLHRLRGHDDEVQSLQWGPLRGESIFGKDEDADQSDKGCLLASAGKDRTIRVWSTAEGRQVWIQRVPGQRMWQEDGGRSRVWVALLWSPQRPTELISSTPSGNLLLWQLTKSEKQKWVQFSTDSATRGHSRLVFNLGAAQGEESTILCSVSMDRQVCTWDLDSLKCTRTIPTLGGYVYSLTQSSINPGRLAVGCGDTLIRVWNIGNHDNPYDCTTLWQGIKAKVTCLGWHPTKENWLAFGTEEGRVGIYDVITAKPPLISSTYHKKTVYVVTWGPAPASNTGADGERSSFVLYSCGDGNVLIHSPGRLDESAKNLNKIILEKNQLQHRPGGWSEVSWKPDFSVVALGNDVGSVDVLTPDMMLLCHIQTHRKLINCICWHPDFTAMSPEGSPNKNWIATGSNESSIHVINLDTVLGDLKASKENPKNITDTYHQLDGHSYRITKLSWSVHDEGRLVSCSYDGTAQVWDVMKGVPLANFRGHQGRLFSVQWSILDPDVVFSGGDDCTVQNWRVSEQTHKSPPPPQAQEKRPARNKRGKKKQQSFTQRVTEEVPQGVPQAGGDAGISMAEIDKLIQQRKEELMQKASENGSTSAESETPSAVSEVESTSQPSGTDDSAPRTELRSASVEKRPDDVTEPASPETAEPVMETVKKVSEPKRRRRFKSLLPICATKENCSKLAGQKDCLLLAKYLYGNEPLPEESIHLGLFGSRRDVYRLLRAEEEHHYQSGNIEQALILQIWRGNITEALRSAANRGHLSDWLIALSPMSSQHLWTELCQKYAAQLVENGQYHKATTYLLAIRQTHQAIKMLKQHGLLREALTLAKLRLSPHDPLLQDLPGYWASYLQEIGDTNFELMTKCYLSAGKKEDALTTLSRRTNTEVLETTAEIAFVMKDAETAQLYGNSLVSDCQAKDELLDLALQFVKRHKEYFKSGYCCLVLYIAVSEHIGKSDKAKDVATTEDNSNTLPWPARLMGGQTLIKHVMSTWQSDNIMTSDPSDIQQVYTSLQDKQSGRQKGGMRRPVLNFAVTELTMFILDLWRSEVKKGLKHLESALNHCHQSGHDDLMVLLCQLIMPYGPQAALDQMTAMSQSDSILQNVDQSNWILERLTLLHQQAVQCMPHTSETKDNQAVSIAGGIDVTSADHSYSVVDDPVNIPGDSVKESSSKVSEVNELSKNSSLSVATTTSQTEQMNATTNDSSPQDPPGGSAVIWRTNPEKSTMQADEVNEIMSNLTLALDKVTSVLCEGQTMTSVDPANESEVFKDSSALTHQSSSVDQETLTTSEHIEKIATSIHSEEISTSIKNEKVPTNGQREGLATSEQKDSLATNEQKDIVPTEGQKGEIPTSEHSDGTPINEQSDGISTSEQSDGIPTNEHEEKLI